MRGGLETQVWVAQGIADLRPAVLRLANGRVTLLLDDGSRAFDVPAREVRYQGRWYWFNSVFDLVVEDVRYRVALMRAPSGEGVGLRAARSAGAAWKTALQR